MPRSAIIWTRSRELNFKREVPPHAQDDHFAIEVSPLEEFLCRGKVCHPPAVPRPAARFKFLHQNRRQLQVSRPPEKERGEGQLSFSLFGALVVG
jgi:hypothetical protein